jgi:CDP-paratose 2-epimerase
MSGISVFGVDNLSRRGSETSLELLKKNDVGFFHGDIRLASDMAILPKADWVLDCAANPSVLAGTGVGGAASPLSLVENNLYGTVGILEYCRRHRAGLVLMSSSRVYSIEALSAIKFKRTATRLVPAAYGTVKGFSAAGVSEQFATTAPVSLYGATKLASETMALEYAGAFSFPLWINRCGVLAGPGQFGRADQGIFSFWAYSHALGRPLKFTGYNGKQVRDCLSCGDLAELVRLQLLNPDRRAPKIINVGGGVEGSMSLLELDRFCGGYFGSGSRAVDTGEVRPFDIPYYVSDSSLARKHWGWRPTRTAEEITGDICRWTAGNLDTVKKWF